MKIIFILFLMCMGIILNAQKIYHVRTDVSDNNFTVKYDISGSEGQKCAVRLFVSTDEGKTFDKEVTDAIGDIGDNVEVGKKKKITWDASNENLDAEKVKFSLQIMAIGLPPKKKKK